MVIGVRVKPQKNKIGKEFIRYEQRRIKILPIRRKNDER